MVLGTLAAIIHGAGLPLMMLVFGDMTDSFAGAGNLGNITFSNTTNASKCCLWYWFFWKLDEKSLTHSEVCGVLTKYALICSVLQEVEGSELWFICNECEKMIFTIIRTYSVSAGRDRWGKRALWSQKYPGSFRKSYWKLIWYFNSKWESVT